MSERSRARQIEDIAVECDLYANYRYGGPDDLDAIERPSADDVQDLVLFGSTETYTKVLSIIEGIQSKYGAGSREHDVLTDVLDDLYQAGL